MPNSRYSPLHLVLGSALLLTLAPSGCAVGVAPEVEDSPLAPGGNGNGGGASGPGGSGAGMPSPPSNGGTTSMSGSGNAFGGSAGSGGKGGSGSGGASGGTGSAGSAGSAGNSGSGGASTGGSGGASGGCGCSKTLAWMDNANLSWTTGDCVTTGGVTYRYVGMKAQTYANGDCNPAKQLPWCSDSGNDYKFMACP